MKLKELEKRLEREPTNLGLRVQVAGLLREAGRSVEAVEHYRAVALAYRDQGRIQQAIAVCRSILEIAPEDAACQGLLASLQARPSRLSFEETPLPRPVPYHVIDPTSQQYKVSERELQLPLPPGDTTPVPASVPTSQLDAAEEIETRQLPKIRTDQLAKLDEVTAPGDDTLTEPRDALAPRTSDDEMTRPRERPSLFEPDDD